MIFIIFIIKFNAIRYATNHYIYYFIIFVVIHTDDRPIVIFASLPRAVNRLNGALAIIRRSAYSAYF